jgi:hypothetical protein
MIRKMTLGLLAAVSIASTVLAANQPPQDKQVTAAAERFVRGIYAHYRKDGEGIGTDSTAVYTASLLALMRADQQAAGPGEVGLIDGDPLCDCQDFEIDAVRLALRPSGQNRLDAEVKFHNLDRDVSLRLELLLTPAGWRVDNVDSAGWEGGSLRAALQRELKPAGH